MNNQFTFDVESRSLLLFSDAEDACSTVTFTIESPDLYWEHEDALVFDYESVTAIERKSRICKRSKLVTRKAPARRRLSFSWQSPPHNALQQPDAVHGAKPAQQNDKPA